MMPAGDYSNKSQVLLAELDSRFRVPLMSYFLRRVGDRTEAEDLTQETFVRLIGSATFERADQAHAFVFRVASNLLRDRARLAARWKKHPYTPLDFTLIDEVAREIAEDRGPERVLIGRESLAEVLAALDELGERTKSIYILFRLEGMKQKDIATLFGMGLSTVEKHVMTATVHLGKRFGPRPL